MKIFLKMGGQGDLPLGCLPLWGREGVILIADETNNRILGK
jgi:hypothetical protein